VSKLFLIGAGLMGSSLAVALKRAGAFARVVGYDVDAATIARATASGVIDDAAPNLAAGARDCDAVAVAVPPQSIAATVVDVFRALGARSVPVFDLGSVKAPVIDGIVARMGSVPTPFVPCHPLAGRELRGTDAADGALFVGRRVFMTPLSSTSREARDAVAGWWRACGADVQVVGAAEHDAAVAATSHLPHLLSSAYVATLAERVDRLARFAGPGFKDFTRIAGADPELWRQILVANAHNVSADLTALIDVLERVRDGLAAGDEAALADALSRGAEAKGRFRDGGG